MAPIDDNFKLITKNSMFVKSCKTCLMEDLGDWFLAWWNVCSNRN